MANDLIARALAQGALKKLDTILIAGTASEGGSNYLVDESKSFEIDSLVNKVISITIDGVDYQRIITSNTEHSISFNELDPDDDSIVVIEGTKYAIYKEDISSEFITDIKRVGMADRSQTAVPYITNDNTIHLDKTGSSWVYYIDGRRIVQSSNKSLTFDNTSAGIRWFYIDDITGDIKTKTSTVDFGSECAIAYCLINPTMPEGQKCLIGDERHTIDWDSSMHVYEHLTVGTQKISGGEISGYTLYSGTDAHKQYSISQAEIYDEDIRISLEALSGGNGKYTNFYRTSAGVWGWQLNANFPFRYTSSGRMNYDNATANGAQSASARFLNTYVFLTNLSGQARHITITSQTTYETYSDALGESLDDLNLAGLVIPEFVCINKITWYTDDTISGTGKCYIYNVQDYDTNPIDLSLGNISTGLLANTIQVATNGNDTIADGSILKPFKTIQAAINKSKFGNYIQLGVGQFNENITVDGISNLFIQSLGSTDSYATVIANSGNLTISGSSTTRVRHRDLQFNGKLTIDGTQGRHYFDNVYFGQGADFINAIQRWHEFNLCTIDGNVNIGVTGTPTAGTTIRFRNCTFGGIVTISSSNVTVTFDNCRNIRLVHNAGKVVFLNENTFLKDGSGYSIVSTATNDNTNNQLIINGCNFQQSDLTYGRINKTGNCGYIIGNCNRDVANDTLTGTRLNYSRNAKDVGYSNAVSGLSATNTQDAIDSVGSQLNDIANEPLSIKQNNFLGRNGRNLPFELLSAFDESGWTATSTGNLEDDTVNVRHGDKSMKITTPAGTYAYLSRSKTFSAANKLLVIDWYAADLTNFSHMQIMLQVGDSWSTYLTMVIEPKVNMEFRPGWNRIIVNPMLFEGTGTTGNSNNTTITGIRIRTYAKNTGTFPITFDRIGLIPNPMKEAIITLTFDDGNKSDYTTARPYMNKYNFAGVSNVVPTIVEAGTRMTLSDIQDLYDQGWDICSHGWSHIYEYEDDDVIKREMIQSYEWLAKKGFLRSADHIAFPGGVTNDSIEAVVKQIYKTARTTAGIGNWGLNTLPVMNPYRLKVVGVSSSRTLTDMKAYVDKAIASNSWLIFMFHDIKDSPSADGWTTANFRALIDYIAEKQVTVKTMSEMSEYMPDSISGRLERQVRYNDIEIADATKGIILTSPNGTKYRVTVENDGALTATEA